tara:strand:+ start:193 stop:423 length:231 start_codon:yes stop_codon:yes gene_type:complete
MSGFKRREDRFEKLHDTLHEIENDSRQLSKMARALAHEGRETLDRLGDVDYYLWFIEAYGTELDVMNAEITQEEEE